MVNKNYLLPEYHQAQEPSLSFHPERTSEVEIHPLRGLLKFGPYGQNTMAAIRGSIRLAVICPTGYLARVEKFLSGLNSQYDTKHKPEYTPNFPGMTSAFRVNTKVESHLTHELAVNLVELKMKTSPHLAFAETLSNVVRSFSKQRHNFDLLVVYLPDGLEEFFVDAESGFDLHDYVKAESANNDIVTQFLRDKAFTAQCKSTNYWNLALAIYTKVGGIPWKMSSIEDNIAFMGISYSIRHNVEVENGKPRFITCCSQVFDSQGRGLEFVAFEAKPHSFQGENPFLGSEEMARLVSRGMEIFRSHNGRPPKRLVIYKTTDFRREEVNGCFDAWSKNEDLDLISVNQSSPWKGVLLNKQPKNPKKAWPSFFPVNRGTYLQIGEYELLLWTQGNVNGIAPNGNAFYREARGIPEPLHLTRWGGHGSWNDVVNYTLALTKMNWNNSGLYDPLPATLLVSSKLAKFVKHMPSLSELVNHKYDLRFFL